MIGHLPPIMGSARFNSTVYLSQIGPDQQGFFDFFTRELRPRLDDLLSS